MNTRIAVWVWAAAFLLSMTFLLLARIFEGPFIIVFALLTWPSYLVGALVLLLGRLEFDPGQFSTKSLYLVGTLFCAFSATIWSVLIGFLARRAGNTAPPAAPTKAGE